MAFSDTKSKSAEEELAARRLQCRKMRQTIRWQFVLSTAVLIWNSVGSLMEPRVCSKLDPVLHSQGLVICPAILGIWITVEDRGPNEGLPLLWLDCYT